jgi:hypothetical protein
MRRRPPPKSLSGLSSEEARAEIQRELIENLRRDLLRPGEREFLANALEALWFPSSELVKDRKDIAKATVRQWKAELYRMEIKGIAAAENISIHDAKKKVREIFTLQSLDALEQYMKRARQEQRRGTRRQRRRGVKKSGKNVL